jgi:hypothetical protein
MDKEKLNDIIENVGAIVIIACITTITIYFIKLIME